MNNGIPAVEKTVALLNYLSDRPEGATQAQLKKELGISMSTTYRILQTLLDSHWVRKRGDGVYLLGSGLLPILNRFRGGTKMLDHFQSIIDLIAREHEIACKISVRRGGEQLTLMRAEPEAPIALTGKTGSRFPVVEGSVGAALLCRDAEAQLRKLLADCPEGIPEKKDPELLFRGIEAVCRDGYVVNSNNRWRITALSAPVCNADGSVFAALTFIIPDPPAQELSALGGLLKDSARECEESMNPQGQN